MSWTQKDRNRARKLIGKLADAVGGQQAIASELGIGRQAVHQWALTGRVPVAHCTKIVAMAEKSGISFTASDINPDARILLQPQVTA